ncbi:MAG: hypothetical protein ABSF90_16115 [Syntrophobacteraceae bacterium]
MWDLENEIEQYSKMMTDNHVFVLSHSVENLIERISAPADALKPAVEF